MEPIVLTEEHISKLLEMCKTLFPEYDRLSIKEHQIDVNESITLISLFSSNENYNQKDGFSFPCIGNHFHWYEFCVIHLCRVIGNSNRSNYAEIFDERDLRSNLIFETELSGDFHVVDFLYKNFKLII